MVFTLEREICKFEYLVNPDFSHHLAGKSAVNQQGSSHHRTTGSNGGQAAHPADVARSRDMYHGHTRRLQKAAIPEPSRASSEKKLDRCLMAGTSGALPESASKSGPSGDPSLSPAQPDPRTPTNQPTTSSFSPARTAPAPAPPPSKVSLRHAGRCLTRVAYFGQRETPETTRPPAPRFPANQSSPLVC